MVNYNAYRTRVVLDPHFSSTLYWVEKRARFANCDGPDPDAALWIQELFDADWMLIKTFTSELGAETYKDSLEKKAVVVDILNKRLNERCSLKGTS